MNKIAEETGRDANTLHAQTFAPCWQLWIRHHYSRTLLVLTVLVSDNSAAAPGGWRNGRNALLNGKSGRYTFQTATDAADSCMLIPLNRTAQAFITSGHGASSMGLDIDGHGRWNPASLSSAEGSCRLQLPTHVVAPVASHTEQFVGQDALQPQPFTKKPWAHRCCCCCRDGQSRGRSHRRSTDELTTTIPSSPTSSHHNHPSIPSLDQTIIAQT